MSLSYSIAFYSLGIACCHQRAGALCRYYSWRDMLASSAALFLILIATFMPQIAIPGAISARYSNKVLYWHIDQIPAAGNAERQLSAPLRQRAPSLLLWFFWFLTYLSSRRAWQLGCLSYGPCYSLQAGKTCCIYRKYIPRPFVYGCLYGAGNCRIGRPCRRLSLSI